jgi:hypothetical protein
VTTGKRSAPGRLFAVLGATITIGITLTACGGGGHSKSTSTSASSPTSTTSTTATTPKKKHKGPPQFMTSIGRSTSDKTPGASVTAKPGDSLAFSTRVTHSTAKTVTITLTVPTASSKKLTLKASAEGHSSTVDVTGADGKSITLLRPRYACSLPPTPAFCPASDVNSSHGTYTMKFTAAPKTTVSLVSTVGPTSLKTPKSLPSHSGSVPPYTVKQLVKVLPAAGSSGSNLSPVSSVSTSSGNSIEMISRLTGKRGAAQPLTITFPATASKTITISAQVKGGKASVATVKSGSGSPIKLTLPRYVCFLPPSPTFCPATSAKLSSGKYTVVFNSLPGPAPPSLQAKVESG